MSETGVAGVKMQVERTDHGDWKIVFQLVLDEIRKLMSQYHVLKPELFVQCFGEDCNERALRDKFYCRVCQPVGAVKIPLFPDPNSPTIPKPTILSDPSKRFALAEWLGAKWVRVAVNLDIEPHIIRDGYRGPHPSEIDYSFAFLTSLAERDTTIMDGLAKALIESGCGDAVTEANGFKSTCKLTLFLKW